MLGGFLVVLCVSDGIRDLPTDDENVTGAFCSWYELSWSPLISEHLLDARDDDTLLAPPTET